MSFVLSPDRTKIFAEGRLEAKTPEAFVAFVGERGLQDSAARVTVVFNSPGGTLTAGMKLGLAIRKLKFDTAVGRIPISGDRAAPESGICFSACPFAFIGGVRRSLRPGDQLGVHQHFPAHDREMKLADYAKASQFLNATMLAHIREMGVDARLLEVASQVDPSGMRTLTPEEALAWSVVTPPAVPATPNLAFPASKILPILPRPAVRPENKPDNETTRPSAQAGETFRDCPACPEMVVVPVGEFTMGSNDYDSEEPPHKVTIRQPFAVGKFEVTFEEWEGCVAVGECASNRSPNDEGWGKGRRPVINVSSDDAEQYAAWLSRKTGKTYRLLSEAEWEYAARAGTTTRFSWGSDIGRGNANCDGCRSQWDNKQTAPVGSFKPNAFGLYDMHGNVWEWCDDNWRQNYQGAPQDGSAWAGGDPRVRVLRGGSWTTNQVHLRSANRDRFVLINRYNNVGFRVAMTLDLSAMSPALPAKTTDQALYRILEEEPPVELNVRAGPSDKHPIIGTFSPDVTDIVVRRCEPAAGYRYKWCVVSHKDLEGWAYARYLVRMGTKDTRPD